MSLQNILDLAAGTDEQSLARILHEELPVRFAQRIKMLEALPRWQEQPPIATVRQMYITSFKELRLADPEDSDTFQRRLRNIKKRHSHTNLLVNGFKHYAEVDLLEVGDINEWLDNFFTLRVSTNMLMSHFLHIAGGDPAKGSSVQGVDLDFDPDYNPYVSSIDPECCPARVARHAAHLVTRMCQLRYGVAPRIAVTDCGAPSFSFVPRYLLYIFSELLKNSVRATVEEHCGGPNYVRTEAALPDVHVLVSGDEETCGIRVSDEGGGIPVQNLNLVWSYFYTTAEPIVSPVSRRTVDEPADIRWLMQKVADEKVFGGATEQVDSVLRHSPLAGLGCGLPLSRLYATYLGGRIELQTLPRYGTDVFVYLSRLGHSKPKPRGR